MPSVKDDLPELPKPAIKDEADLLAELGAGAFTADQLQSYARLAVQQAVLVERERCANLCEQRLGQIDSAKLDNAAEIRKLAQLVIDEAFKLPAPNEHTPRLVMLADAINRMATPAA